MKTNNNIHISTAVTLDDIIFSNRNQAYGAYHLRKKYNNYLLYSLLAVVTVLGTGYSISLIINHFKLEPKISTPPLSDTVSVELQDYIPPKPPEIQYEPSKEIVKLTKPDGSIKIVDSIPELKETLGNTLLADPENSPSSGVTAGTLIINDSDPLIPTDDDTFTPGIGEPATFEGEGIEKFHDWVQKNIIYPSEAEEIGIDGKVNLSFIVNKFGEVCDIIILRGVHPSINNETTRVLLSSPKWQPAKQNGHPVKQKFYMPVFYKLQ